MCISHQHYYQTCVQLIQRSDINMFFQTHDGILYIWNCIYGVDSVTIWVLMYGINYCKWIRTKLKLSQKKKLKGMNPGMIVYISNKMCFAEFNTIYFDPFINTYTIGWCMQCMVHFVSECTVRRVWMSNWIELNWIGFDSETSAWTYRHIFGLTHHGKAFRKHCIECNAMRFIYTWNSGLVRVKYVFSMHFITFSTIWLAFWCSHSCGIIFWFGGWSSYFH